MLTYVQATAVQRGPASPKKAGSVGTVKYESQAGPTGQVAKGERYMAKSLETLAANHCPCVVGSFLPSVKITSQDINNIFSTPSSPHPARLSVDLDFSSAIDSICSSTLVTANISAQDSPVFTTDSQSSWLPNLLTSPPVTSAQPSQSPLQKPQDFVLFDSPEPCQAALNLSSSLFGQHRHSHHRQKDTNLVNATLQNQRVAQPLQALGQHPSCPVNANHFAPRSYASSVPTSAVSLSPYQRIHSARPPVPLFNQSTGTVHQQQPTKMMNAADVDLDFPADFTAFGGGAALFPSPAMSSAGDFCGNKSSSASTLSTISPHELLNNDFMSTPNSAALTALTTPSSNYMESPDAGFDVSPNFGSMEYEGFSDSWVSLFPSEPSCKEAQVKELEQASTETGDDEDFVKDQASAVGSRTTINKSPASGGRHSSVAGVNSRRRSKPLSPIIAPDVNDIPAMKRHRNTLAARKSRERKALRLMELEDQIAKLEAERDHWKSVALSQSGAQ
ncbi:hypothetical protein E4U21_005953 [Claviceps maximensis]|nr:hypothetical protein E4U21_005953 [Claviceps maximensis]